MGENSGSAGNQAGMSQLAAMDENAMAAALDQWLAGDPDQEVLLTIYDEYIAGSTYEENMKSFGKVSYDAPSSISIYTDSFENKRISRIASQNIMKKPTRMPVSCITIMWRC